MSIGNILATQLRLLGDKIAEANQPGNLDGEFTRFICRSAEQQPVTWQLSLTDWQTRLAEDQFSFPLIAALGFEISISPNGTASSLFCSCLSRLKQRQALPNDRISFAFHPSAFLGIALGAVTCGEREGKEWLAQVLTQVPKLDASVLNSMLYNLIEFTLTGEVLHLGALPEGSVVDMSAIYMASRLGAVSLYDATLATRLQQRILEGAIKTVPADLDAKAASIVWAAVSTIITMSVSELLLSVGHVSVALRRFESAMRRWRWDAEGRVKEPIRWPITQEREVQDILWLILASLFADVVDEEALPKLGHGFYKADFGIPSLRLLIEAKYCRSAGDFKRIEDEIMKDAFAYLESGRQWYDRLLVFIYDDSASVQEHETTRSALLKKREIEDVVIVSHPSQLPWPRGVMDSAEATPFPLCGLCSVHTRPQPVTGGCP